MEFELRPADGFLGHDWTKYLKTRFDNGVTSLLNVDKWESIIQLHYNDYLVIDYLFGAWGSHCDVIFSITNEDYAFR